MNGIVEPSSNSGPLQLVRSIPAGADPDRCVLFADIPDAAVKRSRVLSSILEADGDATFPEALTMHDFDAWRTFVSGDGLAASLSDVASACDVLKVCLSLTGLDQ